MKFITLVAAIFISLPSIAQYDVRISVKNKQGKPLSAASVFIKSINKGTVTDTTGVAVIYNIPAGRYDVHVTYVEYEENVVTILVPDQDVVSVELNLKGEDENDAHEDEEEVTVYSVRSSRTIANEPTRVEIISGEELDEKGNMKPGDIRMLLFESTGIQTQQISATSYNSSIRIQGLEGRYTQLLKDGLPMYGGFAGGLSIMQIAPLDLKQVEVIKGSASTLYGGGAIAGLVNLITKEPGEEREISFMANGTTAKGLDLSGFYSEKFNKAGITLFGSVNTMEAYDPADIGLSAIPQSDRYTLNPSFFLYGNSTDVRIGVSGTWENRLGGSMNFIKNRTTGYFEENKTDRYNGLISVTHRFSGKSKLIFKSSFNHFNRRIETPGYIFRGRQLSTFSEVNYSRNSGDHEWIGGLNLVTDKFKDLELQTSPSRNYEENIIGGFIQNTFNAGNIFSIESGFRVDHVSEYDFQFLPRVALLFKFSPSFSSRIGGGLGYKTPNMFTEEAEQRHFENILAIDKDDVEIEKSYGLNADINFRTKIGTVDFSFNNLFFYTYLDNPIMLIPVIGGNNYGFRNSDGNIITKGIETNLKLIWKDFKLFLGYTYTDATEEENFFDTRIWRPLTPRHKLNNVLMYEVEDKWKVGLEAYYFSPQKLNDNKRGKSYWVNGFMVERLWEHFSVFINFENFLDTRQTKFDTIYTGTIDNPVFRDIYAPVDGRVINGGFKIRL